MDIILITLLFLLYSMAGTVICDKLGILDRFDEDSISDMICGGMVIVFWPVAAVVEILFYY